MHDTLNIPELVQEGKRRRLIVSIPNYILIALFLGTLLSGYLLTMTPQHSDVVYVLASDQWVALEAPFSGPLDQIQIDTDGSVWVLEDEDDGLWRYDAESEEWQRFEMTKDDPTEIAAFDVLAGEVWAFREEDVAHYTHGGWEIDPYPVHSSYAGAAVAIHETTVMLLDYFGNTAYFNGDYWIDYDPDYDLPGYKSDSPDYYGTLVAADNGDFWIAFNGIYRYQRRSGSWALVRSTAPDQIDYEQVVGATEGRVWVTTRDELVAYLLNGTPDVSPVRLSDFGISSGADVYQIARIGGQNWMVTSVGCFVDRGNGWEQSIALPDGVSDARIAARADGTVYLISHLSANGVLSAAVRSTTLNTSPLARITMLLLLLLTVAIVVRLIVWNVGRNRRMRKVREILAATIGEQVLEHPNPALREAERKTARQKLLARLAFGIAVWAGLTLVNPLHSQIPALTGLPYGIGAFILFDSLRQMVVAIIGKRDPSTQKRSHPLENLEIGADGVPAVRSPSADPMTRLQVAEQAHVQGRYEEADTLLRSLIPYFWGKRNLIGVSMMIGNVGDTLDMRGIRDQALKYYEAALRISPENPLRYLSFADHYQLHPTDPAPERALEWTQAAVELMPRRGNHLQQWFNRIIWSFHMLALANLGRTAEANDAMIRALSPITPISPYHSAFVHFMCGRAALALGDSALARRYLDYCAITVPDAAIGAKARSILATIPPTE
ncbi:MAG: hypothetical protein U0670_21495 [Anaerolineae bacterium]